MFNCIGGLFFDHSKGIQMATCYHKAPESHPATRQPFTWPEGKPWSEVRPFLDPGEARFALKCLGFLWRCKLFVPGKDPSTQSITQTTTFFLTPSFTSETEAPSFFRPPAPGTQTSFGALMPSIHRFRAPFWTKVVRENHVQVARQGLFLPPVFLQLKTNEGSMSCIAHRSGITLLYPYTDSLKNQTRTENQQLILQQTSKQRQSHFDTT